MSDIITINFIDRFQRFDFSTSTNMSSETLKENDISENDRYFSCNGNIDPNNIQVPIVGYEIMEERARFTVSLLIYGVVIVLRGLIYILILK